MSRPAEVDAPRALHGASNLADALPRIANGEVRRSDPRVLGMLRRLSRGTAFTAIAVGMLVLFGWALDIELLKSVRPGLVTMKPNTALAFVLAGVAFWTLQSGWVIPHARAVTLACATVVAAIGLLTLSEDLWGLDIGIDRLLFEETAPAVQTGAPGRMSPATALSFSIVGAALFILASPGQRRYRFAQSLALLALAISTLGLLGYAYDIESLYRWPPYASMAVHTAIVMFVLSLGIISAAAVRLDSSLLASPRSGGTVIRELLPSGIAVLVLLSLARLAGEKVGFYGTGLGLAFMVTSAAAVLTAVVWLTARRLERADIERENADARTRETKRMLEDLLASVAEGVVCVDEDQRIVLYNDAAQRIFGHSRDDLIGQPLGMLIPERFRARHEEQVRHFAATGRSSRSMGRYGVVFGLRANGEEFPMDATISQSGTAPGRLFTVVLRDITERLRTERERRAYTERLRMLSRRLFEVEENERRRLARELHDSIGQNVTALTMSLNMVRSELPAESREKIGAHLNDCEVLLYSTHQLVRDVMAGLRPPGLDELGFLSALTEHARQVEGRGGFSVTVKGTEITPRLSPATEITLFRIAQEALVNVAKHALATEVVIDLESTSDTVRLTVADNGCGFDPATRLAEAVGHLGVVSMRERAESIGGRLKVESTPGRGTCVTVEAPRAAAANHSSSPATGGGGDEEIDYPAR